MRRVNELVRHHVAEIIAREIELPLDVFVTITHVETAPDLKTAAVYLTVLPDHKRVSTIKMIESRRGVIRKCLSKRMKTKFIPHLNFLFDEREIKAQRIFDVMDSI